jgi:hypothetical protein
MYSGYPGRLRMDCSRSRLPVPKASRYVIRAGPTIVRTPGQCSAAIRKMPVQTVASPK